jgi:hypothetical protein
MTYVLGADQTTDNFNASRKQKRLNKLEHIIFQRPKEEQLGGAG